MKRSLLVPVLLVLFLGLNAQVSQSLAGVDSLKVGDAFELIIDTDFPLKDIQIPDTLTSFRVVDQSIESRTSGSRARLSIVPLRLGTLSFPKLGLRNARFLGEGGETDAFRVFVLRSRAEADTLLRDIKPLREYPVQFPFLVYILLLLSALVLVVILIVLAFRKPARAVQIRPAPVPPAPRIPAHQKALALLEELVQSGLARQNVLAYHFRMSMILREFLEESFGFGAIQMTSSEIADSLQVQSPRLKNDYLKVLYYCDMVKFAGQEPDFEEIMRQTEYLRLCLQASGGAVNV